MLRPVLNYFSFTWFIILYGCSLFVYLKLNRLPEYGWPDPKGLLFDYDLCFNVMHISIAANFIAILMNAWYLTSNITGKTRLKSFSIWFFAVNLLLLFVCVKIDPLGFLDWFLD